MQASDVLEIVGVLGSLGIETSIEGGWGVDALIGEETRAHADLDLAVDRAACETARSGLQAAGFAEARNAEPGWPARLVLADSGGRTVDLHPLLFDLEGNGWQQLTPEGGWLLHSAEHLWHEGRVGGRSVSCIAPELQLRFRLGYVWTERDRHDLRLLHERFGVPLPPTSES
jgi:lincosamide nucleotidyltransferase A/C/D/E